MDVLTICQDHFYSMVTGSTNFSTINQYIYFRTGRYNTLTPKENWQLPMTHGSVVAREHCIPVIVGVPKATASLQSGQRVCVDGNRGVIEIL